MLRGHFWTLLPHLGRSVRAPKGGPGEPWSVAVEDLLVGGATLRGSLRLVPGARELVVLVHGLGGSADSDYLRLAERVAAGAGMATLRLSLRGADLEGQDFYHAGLVGDVAAALRSPELAVYERLYLLGYSLGGHVALRLAATTRVERLVAVAAVCAPLDLRLTSEAIDHRLAAAPYRMYLLYYLKQMYARVARHRALAASVERVREVRFMREWDELVVAPRFGFAGALDYYQRMSVGPLLGDLTVPALLVAAMHDPMVPPETVAPALRSAPPLLTTRWVEEGGHLGFPARLDLGLGIAGGGDSLESQLLAWLRRSGGILPVLNR